MARRIKDDVEFSAECGEAYRNLLAHADVTASRLTGDRLDPGTGAPSTPRSMALALGMIAFLLRADRADLHALLFAEKSLGQVEPKPYRGRGQPVLDALIRDG